MSVQAAASVSCLLKFQRATSPKFLHEFSSIWTMPCKKFFSLMWTEKVPVWSGPILSANRINGCYRMYELKAKACTILCTCAGCSESAHVQRQFFAWCGPSDVRYWSKVLLVQVPSPAPRVILTWKYFIMWACVSLGKLPCPPTDIIAYDIKLALFFMLTG